MWCTKNRINIVLRVRARCSTQGKCFRKSRGGRTVLPGIIQRIKIVSIICNLNKLELYFVYKGASTKIRTSLILVKATDFLWSTVRTSLLSSPGTRK